MVSYCYTVHFHEYKQYVNLSFFYLPPIAVVFLKLQEKVTLGNQTICTCSYNWLKSIVKEILQNQFVQDWRSIVDNSPKCINYRIFKTNLNLEKYLLILPTDLRITFTKLRTWYHRFPIETGRWYNIEKHFRKCTMCDSNSIGDEFHYV